MNYIAYFAKKHLIFVLKVQDAYFIAKLRNMATVLIIVMQLKIFVIKV